MSAALEQVEYVSIERAIPMRRVWAMPSKNTFDVPPMRALVKSYLYQSRISIDPFARNKRWATYTNDLNPDTAAEYHMDALAFLQLLSGRGVQSDLIIFDPPYSVDQCRTSYAGFGAQFDARAVQTAWGDWAQHKDAATAILAPQGVVLSFGWDSNGFGVSRGYELIEMLVVCHGAGHNDTIVTVERKVESAQSELFS
jgi:hypothetical protein